MLDQYRRIKREHQGDVLFFRLGDFYEMFADDALEVSHLLNLTLTSRNGLPMCGIPYHAARSYIARLLRLGKKIAICEQLTEPGRGRGIIEREVVEVITPGTTVDDDYLEKGSSNYLSALSSTARFLSFAYIELSTGEFHATSFPFEEAGERIRLELERLQVKEIVIQESLLEEYPRLAEAILGRPGLVVNRWADWLFDRARSKERLERQFGTVSLKSFGLEEDSPEVISAGALLDYLDNTAKSLLPHIRTIGLYGESEYVGIDESTQRNLELIKNLRDGDVRFSLLEVLDETKTSMGRRLLKWRLLHPLRDLARINKRLDMVEILYHDQGHLALLRDLLGKTPDLERLSSRLAMDRAHGKDMLSIKNALGAFKAVEGLSGKLNLDFESSSATSLVSQGFGRLMSLMELLDRGIAEDPSILLTEGNLIKRGFNPELDTLRQFRDNGRKMLEDYLEEERQSTGIPNLKIQHNRFIGYFFEVTKTNLSKVPPRFIRRQNIVSGERFTTDKLAALESEINGASDKVIELEKKLFLEIRNKAKELIPELSAAARRIAELDTAQSLAWAATSQGWIRPQVNTENRIRVLESRHPVVEAHLKRGEFIPNDVILDGEGVFFALITGPNMAGKSTYLRQTALIVIMAQIGSFIPAKEAEIGMVDRIYCRVGASDNLARGESTFLVEMNETAYILHTATERSLVIMDEVGRGTGTNDGLSIAWAVCEELLDNIKCRTLFATHYHELSLISHPALANRSMEVVDRHGDIVFLRKLKEGSAGESYGLPVARLAGLPERVLQQAGRIMARLKENEKALHEALPDISKPAAELSGEQSYSQDWAEKTGAVLEDILSLDLDRMTPLAALHRIHDWKALLESKGPSRTPKGNHSPGAEKSSPTLFD
ncbi:MAG: DNA mismatch repair protein MutS [Spirochaetaceae bacterium]|jgi:DNA mismatch repair protein MutS|nr:DNA mismatch repair protein MutS [Spirochaetaceae bacterium]